MTRRGGGPLAALPAGLHLKDAVCAYEKALLAASLEDHGGKVAAAAETLGLTRAGLYKKLNKYGLKDES